MSFLAALWLQSCLDIQLRCPDVPVYLRLFIQREANHKCACLLQKECNKATCRLLHLYFHIHGCHRVTGRHEYGAPYRLQHADP